MTNIQSAPNLNQQQKDVVLLGAGAYLVDAGAGSGKTTAVTERVVWMINSGVNADRMLCVTFTVKAAQEMSHRVADRTGRRPLWTTNFHRLCTRLMRMFPEFGMGADFSIADVADTKRLVGDLLREMAPEADVKRTTSQVLDQIARNRAVQLFPEMDPLTFWARRDPWIIPIAEAYDARLTADNRVDFDLMLYKVALTMKANPELASKVASLWDYVMVDEWQDTDLVQFEILKMIAPHGNVVAVGDCDQSVYRFRGAEPKNMFGFVEHFGAKVMPLHINYRSRSEILAIANQVIESNQNRFPKALEASKGRGGQVFVRQFSDSKGEAESVAMEIQTLLRTGVRSEQIAVLYRANSTSRLIETALTACGVRHRVLGGLRFWDRPEVKDVLAWGEVLAGRPDWNAWKRACKSPSCRIGDAGWTKARAAGNPEAGVEAYHAKTAGKMLAAVRAARAGGKNVDSLGKLLETSGYMASVRDECAGNEEELLQRESSIREVLSAARGFDSLGDFLDEIALGASEGGENDRRGVSLSTIHAAKGLEWKHVFIVALADEVLPHYLALKGTEEDVEEERRLFYVAVTRAEESVRMSFASFLEEPGGSSKIVVPSRFIAEGGLQNKIRRYEA